MVVLRRGAKGEDVKRLQTLLKSHGSPSLAVDGDFGPATEAAVRHFQSEHKLVVDGVVGPQTWAALGDAPTDSHEQRVEQAVSYFRKQGWSREQAIGIVANSTPRAAWIRTSSSRAAGPATAWHNGRDRGSSTSSAGPAAPSMVRVSSSNSSSYTYELKHTESSAGNSLMDDRTAEDAAETVTRKYERPADVEGEVVRRRKRAKEIEGRLGR